MDFRFRTGSLSCYGRVPLTEVLFLAIVVQIQSESGGSLSGALSNLSGVLRERANLKGKVQAMSQEAKASAVIIAVLPLLVAAGMFFVSPGYLNPLFYDETGKTLLTLSLIWMLVGVAVMRKMINFEM